MQENVKSKKERLEKLRIILDNPSNGKLHPEDEKHLEALRRRLIGSPKESTVYIYKSYKEDSKEKIDPLKPQVKIYQKEEKKEFIAPEIKHTEPEEKQEAEAYKDEELYEVEKVEIKGPEFLEVKPKEVTEKKEISSTVETEESPKVSDSEVTDTVEDEKDIEDEKLQEWEPVETKNHEFTEVEKIKEEIKSEPVGALPSPLENDLFLPLEKKELEEIEEKKKELELAEKKAKMEDRKREKKLRKEAKIEEKKTRLEAKNSLKERTEIENKISEGNPEFKDENFEQKEGATLEEKPIEEIPGIDGDSKIDIFKDIKSIDEETAILLYDNGFTSIDVVKKASLRDLTRIKGIRKKLAKHIKREIEQKLEESATEIKGEPGEYFILDEKFEEDDAKKIDENISNYDFVEDKKDFFGEEDDEVNKENKKIDVFKDISNIDEKTASLLYENGITSVDILREKSVRELTRIKGIKRKLAKMIKKEIKSMDKKTESMKDYDEKLVHGIKDEPPVEEKVHDEEWESYGTDEMQKQGYTYEDYTLYKKKIETKSGKKRFVRFFSKAEPDEGEPSELPTGFEVKVNKKTGLPYLKKKK
ncbi:MAG: helix-hairpin-helix domain-containing protein [Euryarchaeota archaeon]|nr:helix-hairpin-helix domain-containing protein [Euryarchaeota archaeon]